MIDIVVLIKTLLIIIVIIAIVVVIHELGHFLAAKLVKVRVDEFAFGMGKMLFGKSWKGTLFRFNLLPIGGYVKVYGQEEEKEGVDSFSSKRSIEKIFILVAGVSMNMILAIVVFYMYLASLNFITFVPKIVDYSFPGIQEEIINKPYISGVTIDSPAAQAGIVGDELIWELNGNDVTNADDFKSEIIANYGKTVEIKTMQTRDQSFRVYSVDVNKKNESGTPIIGVVFSQLEMYKLDYREQKLTSGIVHTFNTLIYTIKVYGYLIGESLQQKSLGPISDGTGTIVQVTRITYRFVAADNTSDILNMIASVSLSLALFNILPIPALDGGHIMFIVLAKLRGKPFKQSTLEKVNLIGFSSIMVLFVVLLIKDVTQFQFIQDAFNNFILIFRR